MDVEAHYGDDEFVVFMPETYSPVAVAENIHAADNAFHVSKISGKNRVSMASKTFVQGRRLNGMND